jgi:hypothetical protein
MCDHLERISDPHTGDVICLECGHIVGFVYVEEQERPITTDSKGPSWISWAERMQARDIILEILAHLHLDGYVALVDSALESFLTLLDPAKRLPCVRYCHQRPPFDLTRERIRARLAFAILDTLNKAGTPRPMRRIAELCDVSPKMILQIENTCGTTASYAAPHTYMGLVCSVLDVPRPHQFRRLATLLCEEVERSYYGMRPEILVAACVWSLFSKLREVGEGQTYFINVKIETLCETFGITSRSLRKWLAVLPSYELIIEDGDIKWDALNFCNSC